ncbi:MAG TPA: sigma-E factor negative regulatory protein [Burkholderiales bacterium]|nr:sigma-E factor negative regulatory protein [Burkholderiales bacterium]
MDGVSALMDGELDEHPARGVLAKIKEDPELRERWETYHLISDALKREPLLSPLLSSSGFSAAFAERLEAEPTILAPKKTVLTPRRVTTYALSAAASVSAAALVAWVALSGSEQSPSQIAKSEPVPNAIVVPASVSSDSSMNQYFLLHQGVSPSSEFQGVAPYIRSVSAVRPAEQGR